MSKIDEVRADMVKAMKAKDKDTKETLSMLLAALKNKAIDKRADLTPEEETQVILKEIKQTKETLEMTPADRTDIIEECNRRLTVLEAYAPKMMGEDEIKAIIEGVLSELGIENPTGKDKGNIMKHLMPKVKGKADGILLTGGIAHNPFLVDYVKEMVGFIAPIKVYAGEDEMRALAMNGLMVLRGELSGKIYK